MRTLLTYLYSVALLTGCGTQTVAQNTAMKNDTNDDCKQRRIEMSIENDRPTIDKYHSEQKDHTSTLPERLEWYYDATFRDNRGLCHLYWSSVLLNDPEPATFTIWRDGDTQQNNIAPNVSLDDLIDTAGLRAHNCSCTPEVTCTFIYKGAEENNVLGQYNLGVINNFRVRYFLFYSITAPRPECHDKYQKALYIDIAYNPRTRSFDREEVKFDPAKHKSDNIPLN